MRARKNSAFGHFFRSVRNIQLNVDSGEARELPMAYGKNNSKKQPANLKVLLSNFGTCSK